MANSLEIQKERRWAAIAQGNCGRCLKQPAVRGNYCDDCRKMNGQRRAECDARKLAAEVPLPGIFQPFSRSITIETRKALRAVTDAAQIENAGRMFLRWWLPNVRNGCPVAQHEINRVILESLEVAEKSPNDEYYEKRDFKAVAVQRYPQYDGVDGFL